MWGESFSNKRFFSSFVTCFVRVLLGGNFLGIQATLLGLAKFRAALEGSSHAAVLQRLCPKWQNTKPSVPLQHVRQSQSIDGKPGCLIKSMEPHKDGYTWRTLIHIPSRHHKSELTLDLLELYQVNSSFKFTVWPLQLIFLLQQICHQLYLFKAPCHLHRTHRTTLKGLNSPAEVKA